ncbi:hypothetical protein MKW92_025391 [Papaver armeniacum]|nr:hypothetical protein MKW92_025391 [Papaver armeniacum]
MRSDELNTIIATESATRTVIQPSIGIGQGQEMTGFMKLILIIYGGILLCLAGITLTKGRFGIIFWENWEYVPPIWVAVGTVLLISVVGFLWVCGMAAALVFGLPWMYTYLRGTYPLGFDWVDIDNVRSRIMGTAGQMRDSASIAREYLRSKVKDVAP